MNHITIIRDGGLRTEHSTEYYSSYVGEIVLVRSSREDEYVPLYPGDVVFIMNDEGKTVNKWNIPQNKKED